ncbi:hypothetical protein CDD83_339 [Cordyceps sp. RAO-2017]|nr:hypothetical protein CDD83_339 [Cordyceps sp. RAO-2017]
MQDLSRPPAGPRAELPRCPPKGATTRAASPPSTRSAAIHTYSPVLEPVIAIRPPLSTRPRRTTRPRQSVRLDLDRRNRGRTQTDGDGQTRSAMSHASPLSTRPGRSSRGRCGLLTSDAGHGHVGTAAPRRRRGPAAAAGEASLPMPPRETSQSRPRLPARSLKRTPH